MKLLYVCHTRIGPFYIGYLNGLYHPIYDDESLGGYEHIQHAVDDLAGGHTFSNSKGADTAKLGIPYDLGEWERFGSEES